MFNLYKKHMYSCYYFLMDAMAVEKLIELLTNVHHWDHWHKTQEDDVPARC